MKILKNTLVCAFILSVMAVAMIFPSAINVKAADEIDTQPPVITVFVDEFKVKIGAYPADDAFTVADDSGSCRVSLVWSDGALDELGRLKAGRHTCTITATDQSGNTSSKVIKYVAAKTRKITFTADGAVVEEIEYFLDEIDDLTYPAVPQKRHYSARWEDFTPSLLEDKTVNAVYVPVEYSLIFNADGKTVATKKYTIENQTITEPQIPEKTGYTGKWSGYSPAFEVGQTVEAEYSPIEYKVTFVADGGIVAERNYTVENKTIAEPEVPEKDGYTGKWESYSLTHGNVTVTAVYTKIEEQKPAVPDSGKAKSGCKSDAGAGLTIITFGIAAATLRRKRKG